MKEQLLYKDLAKYYDLFYYWKNYKEEANIINKIISKYKKNKNKKFLDVACGTGKHLQYFCKKYDCTGVDLNKDILSLARKNVKNSKFHQGNMINLNLNEKFDIIVCLFSSIGYVKTYDNLRKTINKFYNHLNEGGIVLIQPWFTKSQWKVGSVHLNTYEDERTRLSRMSYSSIKNNNISVMEMNYLIGEYKKGVKFFKEKHEMGLFDKDKTMKIMNEAGFKVKFDKFLGSGRGIFIGVKK